MVIFMLLYAIFLPTLSGYLLVSFFARCDEKLIFFERLFLGFGLGVGMITFEMFIAALLKIQFALSVFSAIQIFTIIFFAWLLLKSKYSLKQLLGLWQNKGEKEAPSKVSMIRAVLVLLLANWIVLKIFFVIHEGSIRPIFAYDSLENWSSAAKFFFYDKALGLEHSEEHFFGKGYRTFLNYPLNIPLMQVWVSLCLGDINETYMKYWNVFYFISIIALLFFAMRRESSVVIAILSAFLLSSVPLLTYHAIDAYADLPLSYYALAAAVCFRRYTEKPENQEGILVLTGIFLAICIWTKIEGVFFCLAFSTTLLLYLLSKKTSFKKLFRAFLFYSVPICIVGISWFAFIFLNEITGRSAFETFLASGLHFEVIPIILAQIIFSANFNIIFVFFFVVSLLGIKSIFHSDLKYLLFPLIAIMLMYLFVYITTDNYQWAMNLTAINRNILSFIPMMYYVSALMAVHLLKLEEAVT
jgi:hypothetical protein